MGTPSKKVSTKSKKAVLPRGSKKTSKAGLIFPVGRISSMLRGGRFAKRVSASSGVYLSAVLEYLSAELLELSVKAMSQQRHKTKRLTPRAVMLAVRHDNDLGTLLKDVTLSRGGVVPNVQKALEKKHKGSKMSSATPKM